MTSCIMAKNGFMVNCQEVAMKQKSYYVHIHISEMVLSWFVKVKLSSEIILCHSGTTECACVIQLIGMRFFFKLKKLFYFRRQDKVNHCRIRSKREKDKTKYYLIDSVCFDSLYNLIAHYRIHPLRSQVINIYLP